MMEWTSVEERLPWGSTPKPFKLEWDVYDPKGGVRVTAQHPHYWNLDSDDASEQVTHWRPRPLPPEAQEDETYMPDLTDLLGK